MSDERSQSGPEQKGGPADRIGVLHSLAKSISRCCHHLAPRAYSVIMFGALFCTLAVKFFHSARHNCVNEYFSWILIDISVLLGIEVVLAIVCFRFPLKWVIRTVCVFAAVVCAWSVMNAGWLIRTGTQILPTVLLPLIRDPINALTIVSVNLVKMPAVAIILLGPSAAALVFFFYVLVRPLPPDYNRRHFGNRIILSFVIVAVAVLANGAVARWGSLPFTSVGMRSNCQLRAVTSLLFGGSTRIAKTDLAAVEREIPAFDKITIKTLPQYTQTNHNVIIIVLEGIQYSYTSLAETRANFADNPTPYLASVAAAGVEFENTRSTLTHTTKVLFSLLTGRYPSVSQDLAETVPLEKPYASLATILKQNLNFRTAFFQSAKGNFEARPGLVHNLGFDKFWAREDMGDPNAYLGYLACDEFSMLEPIVEWIKADTGPFLLTVLCSVTHDPYEVPDWFAEPAKKPIDRYRQAIRYTDSFIASLDGELAKLNLTEKTIFCVIGDHGEAFGEHGLLGHERIAYEEVLRIPFCLRAPGLAEPKTKITHPISSIDLTPTLLTLLGFDIATAGFDGLNALGPVPADRKVFFAGWLRQGPAGFVKESRKYIYHPSYRAVSVYNLADDAFESLPKQLSQTQAQQVAEQIISWRRYTVFRLDQRPTGQRILFESWLCDWTNRVSRAKLSINKQNGGSAR